MIEVPSPPDVAVLVGDFAGHSAQSIFNWFTRAERLVQWWPANAEVDLRIGGAYRFSWPNPEWTIRGQYTEIENPRHIAFSWHGDPDETLNSKVDLWINDVEGGSRLAVWHSAIPNETEKRQLIEGWIHFGMRLAGMAGDLSEDQQVEQL